jgi:hypothetical protein
MMGPRSIDGPEPLPPGGPPRTRRGHRAGDGGRDGLRKERDRPGQVGSSVCNVGAPAATCSPLCAEESRRRPQLDLAVSAGKLATGTSSQAAGDGGASLAFREAQSRGRVEEDMLDITLHKCTTRDESGKPERREIQSRIPVPDRCLQELHLLGGQRRRRISFSSGS